MASERVFGFETADIRGFSDDLCCAQRANTSDGEKGRCELAGDLVDLSGQGPFANGEPADIFDDLASDAGHGAVVIAETLSNDVEVAVAGQ